MNVENKYWDFSERDLFEIRLALLYYRDFQHGTDGHNRLMIMARLAMHFGFSLNEKNELTHIEWTPAVKGE